MKVTIELTAEQYAQLHVEAEWLELSDEETAIYALFGTGVTIPSVMAINLKTDKTWREYLARISSHD